MKNGRNDPIKPKKFFLTKILNQLLSGFELNLYSNYYGYYKTIKHPVTGNDLDPIKLLLL